MASVREAESAHIRARLEQERLVRELAAERHEAKLLAEIAEEDRKAQADIPRPLSPEEALAARVAALEGRTSAPQAPVVFHPSAERAANQRRDELAKLRLRIEVEARERREAELGLPRAREKAQKRIAFADERRASARDKVKAECKAKLDTVEREYDGEIAAATAPVRQLESKVDG